MEKKAYEKSTAGIFYMIPDPKYVGSYTLYSELQGETGKDPLHIFLFDRVWNLLQIRFKQNLEEIRDAYMGLPRGRIIEPQNIHGNWIVAYGDDFPLKKYRPEIISEFSLQDADKINKVKFEIDPHEKMAPKDQKAVEKALGIRFTHMGWKKTNGR
jgi:hypothetical protein